MIKLLIVLACIFATLAIPYDHQICLANSLIVGRDDYQDLYDWTCKVCDSSNKPIHAHPIEEKAKDVKCILSVYDEYIILAFRYTNTAQNVWQDILYPIQVKKIEFRSKTNTLVATVKFRRLIIRCGKLSKKMSWMI